VGDGDLHHGLPPLGLHGLAVYEDFGNVSLPSNCERLCSM